MRGRNKAQEVRKVIEPELLDREGEAAYTAELGRLRSEVRHIQAHATAMNHLIGCNNQFVKPEQIREEMRALQATLDRAIARQETVALCA